MQYFVLDCSVTAAWFFEDEFNRYTRRVRELLLQPGTTAIAPTIWPAEILNVLFQAQRKKRISAQKVDRALQILAQLPIQVDYLPLNNMGHILHLCRDHTLTSYDALYLEVAIRRNAPLATQDRKLKSVAKAEGLALIA